MGRSVSGIPHKYERKPHAEIKNSPVDLVLNTKQEIVAGAGIIVNDFHDRKDLTPNLCALFVEPEYRNNGIARSILDFARKDAGKAGFSTLYLITDHTTFYEKCGWSFLTMANDSSRPVRVYAAPTIT